MELYGRGSHNTSLPDCFPIGQKARPFYTCLKKFSKSYISITQKNNPLVLVYISEFLGFGNIDCENKFKIYKQSDCLKFIQLVKEHLIVKYNQAEAFQTFLKTNDTNIKKQM